MREPTWIKQVTKNNDVWWIAPQTTNAFPSIKTNVYNLVVVSKWGVKKLTMDMHFNTSSIICKATNS